MVYPKVGRNFKPNKTKDLKNLNVVESVSERHLSDVQKILNIVGTVRVCIFIALACIAKKKSKEIK